MAYIILTVASDVRVRDVDAGIKNKFVWAWLDREIDIAIANAKDRNGNSLRKFKLSEFIKKVDVPGKAMCLAYVRYQTPQCAAYARDKLDQFEYPIGSRLLVRFADGNMQSNIDTKSSIDLLPGSYRAGFSGDFSSDNDAVHQAAKVLEQAGLDPELVLNTPKQVDPSKTERVTYCNIKLPLPQPLVPEDSPVAQRLFIVCQPAAVPERILRDAFSRFGGLIEVYLLPGRNIGYAKFAIKESAGAAMDALHGLCIAGQRIKVLEAEPQKNQTEDSHKRQRVDAME